MKLNELKCELCEKNKKSLNNESLNTSSSTTSEESINKQQVAVKCLECNFFLCSNCFSDHQQIGSFSNHQIVNLTTEPEQEE